MSKKRPEKPKDRSEKAIAVVEDLPPTIITRVNEKCASHAIEDYQCSGNLHVDLPELCLLLGMKEIPVVTQRPAASSSSATDGENIEHDNSEAEKQRLYSNPCVLVVLENEEPLNLKSIKISGWKVDMLVARVLCKILPSLSNLLSLHLWQTRLSDKMVISLNNTFPLCSNLRTVILEGNPLPEQSYHLLMSKDSVLTHLSLRNNRIGEEGARLIGSALSTTTSANRNLVILNLAFNSIGDAGATHIAQGLRFNRGLLCLSLGNNKIGDAGAAHLAKVLGPFALTQEEIVERRHQLLDREQNSSEHSPPTESSLGTPSSSSLNTNLNKSMSKSSVKRKEPPKKEEKTAVTKKDDPKLIKKASELKVQRGKAGKPGAKDKNPSVGDPEDKPGGLNELLDHQGEPLESPLLETTVQGRDGQVLLPGNTALCYLNLSGNKISEQSLPLFLSSLQKQPEGGGLRRLSLQRNSFCPDFEDFVKIQELMALRDPLNKTTAPQPEQEGQGD
ncbi:leucine-rich repeat-containing protein 71 isoform X2 [Gadus macrocephalus]|uniref:leucine-rich repeat-containing protein 71 isoform X2 n=1 Tax=Gadus macrocephalus TaxID=80720 RepID=UPI0028CB9B2D|nr:leucine-rich repeat-containing protein 71 isoform X2 [Gadus macrocephalus]